MKKNYKSNQNALFTIIMEHFLIRKGKLNIFGCIFSWPTEKL